MENNVFTFKTNINCGSCIRAVTPFLDQVNGIKFWEVDTDNPEKVLTVHSEGASAEQVLAAVKQAGFEAR